MSAPGDLRRYPKHDGAADLTVISLGAGVQSTALLMLALEGRIHADCAIFADTQWEPRGVYEHVERLRQLWAEPDVRRYCTGCGARHQLGQPRRCCPDSNPVDAHAYIEDLDAHYRRDLPVVIAALRWASLRRRLRSGDLCRGPGSAAVDHELFDAVQEQRAHAAG